MTSTQPNLKGVFAHMVLKTANVWADALFEFRVLEKAEARETLRKEQSFHRAAAHRAKERLRFRRIRKNVLEGPAVIISRSRLLVNRSYPQGVIADFRFQISKCVRPAGNNSEICILQSEIT